MARGYPDFFGVSTFPYYGPAYRQGSLEVIIPAGDDLYLFHILNKSVLRAGYLHIAKYDNPDNVIILTGFDGVAATQLHLKDLFDRKVFSPHMADLYLTEYDQDGMVATIGIKEDMSIGTEYLFKIWNAGATDMEVDGALYYSVVQ